MKIYDYCAIYGFANFIQSHVMLMLTPGGFFYGVIGCIAFYQLFEVYCAWRVKWED